MKGNQEEVKRIYLDNCCLNRPFDDQTQDRIRMETEAIITIYSKILSNTFILVSSEAIEIEISCIPDQDRKEQISTILKIARVRVNFDEKVKVTANKFEKAGIYAYDALHIACALKGDVDVLFTTDDELIKNYNKLKVKTKMKVMNPLKWIMEVF